MPMDGRVPCRGLPLGTRLWFNIGKPARVGQPASGAARENCTAAWSGVASR